MDVSRIVRLIKKYNLGNTSNKTNKLFQSKYVIGEFCYETTFETTKNFGFKSK